MLELDQYMKAMRIGDIDLAIAIEQIHGLYGYTP